MPPVLWLSSTRYHAPLPENLARKWQALAIGLQRPIHVIGFATGWRPGHFHEHVNFYLMPQPAQAILRYGVIFSWGTVLALWLAWRHNCRLIVAQSPFEGAIGAFVKQIFGLFGRQMALIVESHNDFEGALFMQRQIGARGLYQRLMRAMAGYALRHADALRPVSSSAAEQLRQYAPDTPQCNFMAWVDVASFTQAQRAVPVNASQELVYAGVLIPRKGIHHLLAAFAQLAHPHATLTLAGPPDNPAYAADLHEQARQLGIADRVTFAGGLSQVALAAIFARSRALVLPSLSEGLPRVIVEAMYAGLPIVATNVSGIPDIITDGEQGYLVEPEDVPALTNALDHILRDDVTQMGAAAATKARAFFSTEAFVQGYRDLLTLALTSAEQHHGN